MKAFCSALELLPAAWQTMFWVYASFDSAISISNLYFGVDIGGKKY